MSLVDKVCSGSATLDTSADQVEMYDSAHQFVGGGPLLLIVSLLCWLAGILIELTKIQPFSTCALSLRGSITNFELSDDMTSVKIHSLSNGRTAFIFALAVIPRIGIAIGLGIIGVMYLLYTRALADLLLNCMCLGFVLDLDELVYEAFAPKRIKFFRDLIEPVEYPSKHAMGLVAYMQGALLGVALLGLVFIYVFVIQGITTSIGQLQEVLCGGNTHFVYTTSAATGRVLAAASFFDEDDEGISWTDAELSLLQLAHPELDAKFFDQEEVDASESTDTWAWLRPAGASSLDDEDATITDVDYINMLSKASVAETVNDMSCSDLCGNASNDTATATILGRSIGTDPIFCEGAVEKCWLRNMTAMRTNCGNTCGCGSAKPSFAGFFQTQDQGCPSGCSNDRKIALAGMGCNDTNITTVISNDIWTKYVQGMKSHVFHVDGYSSRIKQDLDKYHEDLSIPADQVDAVHAYVTGDGFWNSLANYQYLLAEDLPHPSGKVGCEFLVSYTVLILTNVDVCDDSGVFKSLKSICPMSCKCDTHPDDCPPSCFV